MASFDTSALLPLYSEGHPRYGEAKAAFDGVERVVVHPCVLSELATVVRRLAKNLGEDGNAAARAAVGHLLQQPRVDVAVEVDHAEAAALYLAHTRISFTDAVVACSQEPVAFDENIWKARAQRA